MLTHCQFYLTTVIHNSSDLDQLANFYLKPLHGLLRTLYGNKIIRHFRVDLESKKATEIDLSICESEIKKIFQIAFYILFLPTTIIGVGLKGLAQFEQSTKTRNKILWDKIKSLSFEHFNKQHPIFLLPQDLLFEHIVAHLNISDMLILKKSSKVFNQILDTSRKTTVSHYRNYLQGIESKNNAKISFNDLITDCQAHSRKFNYTASLIELFGGIDSILRLKSFDIPDLSSWRKQDVSQEVEHLVNSKEANKYPIFKINSKIAREIQEIFIIQYTLFIPKEFTQQISTDAVWHDYIKIYYNLPTKDWHYTDARLDKSIDNIREAFNLSQFWKTFDFDSCRNYAYAYSDSIFSSHFSSAEIKSLIANQSIGYFKHHRFVKYGLPCFIEGSKNKSRNKIRLFRDTPIVLGWRSVEDISKNFKRIPNPSQKIGAPSQVIIYE